MNFWAGSATAVGRACGSAGSLDGICRESTIPDWPPDNFAWLDSVLLQPQAFDDFDGSGLGLMPGQQNVWEPPKQKGPERQIRGNVHCDLQSEISHSTHPEHKLKLMTDDGAPFMCDGCKEPGHGPRYACDYCGGESRSLDLHTRCALAEETLVLPLFGYGKQFECRFLHYCGGESRSLDLHTRCALAEETLVLPLFGYGKQFEFRFLHEPPPPAGEGRRVCDACGEATRGFVYHCSEQDVYLHPCCASLPDRFVHNGRAFDLRRRASRPCLLCPDEEGRHRLSWAYRCYYEDGHAVDLCVACLKLPDRRRWETYTREVGDDALNVDRVLASMFSCIRFDEFGKIAGTVASFITALVLGNLIVKL